MGVRHTRLRECSLVVGSTRYRVDAEGRLEPSPPEDTIAVLVGLEEFELVEDPEPKPKPKPKRKRSRKAATKEP
jgi:hypothetical protein